VVKDQKKNIYEGSSPDEVCFINFAKDIGYEFIKRTKTHIELKVNEEKKVYELMDILSFSARKRMSVVVKDLSKP
jgi:phospholipid-translocating ATPase